MARIQLLPQTTLAAAATTTGTAKANKGRTYLAAQVKLVVAGGGTTCKVWIQTSLDGGTTWIDIMSIALTTATATRANAVTAYIAPGSPPITPAEAALADNTTVNGIIGDKLRAKVITTGTYTGASHVTVDVIAV